MLALVGALYTAKKVVILLRSCCSFFRVHFLPRIFPTKNLKQRFGEWAIVYDAASPVALAYAEELARHGVSIIFITADPDAVRDTVASLPQAFGVETAVILADFSLDLPALKAIQEVIRHKDIGFLVNCVEEALTFPQNLIEVNEENLMQAVKNNPAVMTLLTRSVLPQMLQRSRGAVVNISTGASSKPLPGRVLLTSSMGFLDQFSYALHLEYKSKGIFVQSLLPFQIASIKENLREDWLIPKPQVYAHHAISTLGVSHRTTGYWPHTLQYELIRSIPDLMWVFASRLFIS
uniref:Inactive hydroxysteroid dehydrogenase-like protein 1 n=1 Tax=Knipowitschia caucasica TaxID=637954 RepID=A0AAV2KGE2_KNICA